MRAFVTGGQGFAGSWLVEHLTAEGDDVIAPPAEELDVTDAAGVFDAIAAAAPDVIYHLAALSHVGDSWTDSAETFRVNAFGTLAALEAARRMATPLPRFVLVGSADVYGSVGPDELPLTEASALRPVSPYAASKVASEFLGLQAWFGYGLPVLRVRAFNHVGPGQSDQFVVSGLARQVAHAELEGGTSVMVGNLAARRDFTDVRDVVRAYRLLARDGEPGEVYQVCSGVAVGIDEIAAQLLAMSKVDLRIRTDPSRTRPIDVPVLCGDPGRLRAATGWYPAFELGATLRDVLDWWRARLAVDSQ